MLVLLISSYPEMHKPKLIVDVAVPPEHRRDHMKTLVQFLKKYWIAIVPTVILTPCLLLLNVGYGAKLAIFVEIMVLWALVRAVVKLPPSDQQAQPIKKDDDRR